MSARHIEQHYGFGAARIKVRSEMHRVSEAGVREDLAAIWSEVGSGGPAAVLRRFAISGVGVFALFAFLGIATVGLVRDPSNQNALEVVMLETAEVVPPPPMVEPVRELPVEPEPVLAEPVVPEPPPVLAEVKPEPPPRVAPAPEPVRVEPEVAKVEPPPVERIERPVRELPKPVARPRVQIEAVAVARESSKPLPQVDRLARAAIRPDARIVPRMDAPAAPATDLPDEAASERTFRVAAAHAATSPRGRSIPGVSPAGLSARDLDVPAARSAPTRGAVARPSAPAPARSVPRFEMAAAPVAPPPSALEVPKVVARADRATPAPGSESGSGAPRPGLSGVPLGELSACVTDREEDRLKGAVVAAAKTQGECVSSKGTYRFLETKNVNAFLMWIDRAPSRHVEDRCAELRYALECLQGASRRASR